MLQSQQHQQTPPLHSHLPQSSVEKLVHLEPSAYLIVILVRSVVAFKLWIMSGLLALSDLASLHVMVSNTKVPLRCNFHVSSTMRLRIVLVPLISRVHKTCLD
jgi:hypothetical protein